MSDFWTFAGTINRAETILLNSMESNFDCVKFHSIDEIKEKLLFSGVKKWLIENNRNQFLSNWSILWQSCEDKWILNGVLFEHKIIIEMEVMWSVDVCKEIRPAWLDPSNDDKGIDSQHQKSKYHANLVLITIHLLSQFVFYSRSWINTH